MTFSLPSTSCLRKLPMTFSLPSTSCLLKLPLGIYDATAATTPQILHIWWTKTKRFWILKLLIKPISCKFTLNPFPFEWVLRALIDFTLSNARRFYSSMGNLLDGKGLMPLNLFISSLYTLYFIILFSLDNNILETSKRRAMFYNILSQIIILLEKLWPGCCTLKHCFFYVATSCVSKFKS